MLIENQLKKLGFGTAAVFLLIVAMLLGAPQMYLMAVILALVPVAGWLLNKVLMRGLVCERVSPETADENGRSLITVTVRNEGHFPKFYLRAIDTLPRFVRYAGSPEADSVFLVKLWPGEAGRIKYLIEPQKRGQHKIGPLLIQATDAFGFSELYQKVESYAEILVYPEILPVSPSLLSSGAATGWRDEEDARSRGNGTDFTGVREYRPGDELRRINWKTTARTGTLAVTEYTQGYASDVVLILDRDGNAYEDSGVGKLSAFEYGVKIATAVAATALRQGSKVNISSTGLHSERMLELTGNEELALMLDRFARIEADGEVSLEQQLKYCAPEISAGAIAVIITPRRSDDTALRSALQQWTQPPLSASLHTFWLDKDSFHSAATERKGGKYVGEIDFTSSFGGGTRSDTGFEYQVSVNTNLISLLGGPTYG